MNTFIPAMIAEGLANSKCRRPDFSVNPSVIDS